MRAIIASTVGFWVATTCSAAEFKPFEGPKPIAVFVESNPWSGVIGSETPTVAIYETGEVIFGKRVEGQLVCYRKLLDATELKSVREQFKPAFANNELKTYYDVSDGWSDQNTDGYYLCDGDRTLAVAVYGMSRFDGKPKAWDKFRGRKKAVVPPDEICKLRDWFRKLEFSNLEAWTPRYVEVMFWGESSRTPAASIRWPNEWPGFDSDRAVNVKDFHSVFLDGTELSKLRELLDTPVRQGDLEYPARAGGIEIGGKTLSVAYRYTFPGEPLWRKAFTVDVEKGEDNRQ